MEQTETTAQETTETVDATENNETTASAAVEESAEEAAPEETEEISYHAVEKEGHVTAIWEMQGRKHLRTIDPRSREGKNILSLFTSEHHDESAAA